MDQLTKPGYKQTELGWIPEDWEIRTFGDICNPSKAKYNPLNSENRKCIELEDLAQGTGRLLNVSNSSDKASLKTVFSKRDVLLGKLRPYLRKYFFSDFDGVCSTEIWVLKSKHSIEPEFVFYHAQSDKIIEAANLSTGTKMPRAEWKTVSETQISIPPNIKEQTAIATALSDMDSYIRSLEALIAKKRLIKQGAMQELLTPKEDWEVRKLGECLISSPSYGINAAACDYSDILPAYLRITDISNEGEYLSEKKVSVDHFLSDQYYLDEGDLVIARTGASVGKSYLYGGSDGRLVYAGFLILLKPNSRVLNPGFLKYKLQSREYWDWVSVMSMRSGQPGINSQEISSFEVMLPSISTQNEISDCLKSMDEFILLLRKKLSKALQLKQGMMQELLTGRTRLV